jgi:hypothetical protein
VSRRFAGGPEAITRHPPFEQVQKGFLTRHMRGTFSMPPLLKHQFPPNTKIPLKKIIIFMIYPLVIPMFSEEEETT